MSAARCCVGLSLYGDDSVLIKALVKREDGWIRSCVLIMFVDVVC